MNYSEEYQSDGQYDNCINACQQAIIDCTLCFKEMVGKESNNNCPECCIECIEVCELTMKALLRNSEKASHYMKLCAEICDYCASQCEQHDRKHCQKCAESCRKCAQACKEVI